MTPAMRRRHQVQMFVLLKSRADKACIQTEYRQRISLVSETCNGGQSQVDNTSGTPTTYFSDKSCTLQPANENTQSRLGREYNPQPCVC